MKSALLLVLVAASLSLAVAGGAVAAPSPQTCLQATAHGDLETAKIVRGLDLPGEQARAVRVRLAQYYSVRGFPGLDGLGLSADQIAEIQRRIAAQTAPQHPAGWPCQPFKNPAAVIDYVRRLLVANGFRPASLRFYTASPRQVQFRGIQDGVSLGGTVAKIGPRRIAMGLTAPGYGKTYTFNVGFDV